MSKRDIGRARDTYTHGWQVHCVERSPYVKKDFDAAVDNRPMTVTFKYRAVKNGQELDTSTFMRPNERSLTLAEIAEGFQARVHGIPARVIEQGRRALVGDLPCVSEERLQLIITPAAPRKLVAA